MKKTLIIFFLWLFVSGVIVEHTEIQAGLIPRLKEWVNKEVLTHTDLNAEFNNLTDNIEQATATTKGMAELATSAETITGTDTERTVTPAGLAAKIDTDGTLAGDLDTRIPSQKAVKTYVDFKSEVKNGSFPDYNEADQGVTGSNKSAKAYIDTISTDSASLLFCHNSGSATTTYTFSTDETIPANINVIIENGAIISIDSAKTLTINGSFNAGSYQVFSGDGNVAMGGMNQPVKSSWFATLEKAQESDASHLIIDDDYTLSSEVDFDQDETTIEFISSNKITLVANLHGAITLSGDNNKLIRPYMEGPGTYTHTGGNRYAMVEVTGEDCEVTGGVFLEPETTAVLMNTCTGGYIAYNLIMGGDTANGGSYEHQGIRVANCTKVHLFRNRIRANASNGVCSQGIYLGNDSVSTDDDDGETGHYNRDCIIEKNVITETLDHPIYDGASYRNQFLGNVCKYTDGGIVVTQLDEDNPSIIIGNQVFNTSAGRTGINIRDGVGTVIKGNVISNAGGHGIQLTRQISSGIIDRNIIQGNQIIKATDYGIQFGYNNDGVLATSMSKNIIDSNVIIDCGGENDRGIFIGNTNIDSDDNHITNNFVDDAGYIGIDVIKAQGAIISGNTVKNPGDFGTNCEGIGLSEVTYSKILNNTIYDDRGTPEMNYGINGYDDSTNNTFRGNDISGYTGTPFYQMPTSNIGKQEIVKIGTIAAGTSDERPIFCAEGTNGCFMMDFILVNAADMTAGGTDYTTLAIIDKGSDGTGTDVMTDIDTNTAGDNQSLADFDALSMAGVDDLNSYQTLPLDDILSFQKTDTAGGLATDEMMMTIRYLEF